MTWVRGLEPLALLDQVRESLFHEHLHLAALLLGKATHSREDFGIDLGREFLAGWHRNKRLIKAFLS